MPGPQHTDPAQLQRLTAARVLDLTPDIAVVTDLEGVILFANTALERLIADQLNLAPSRVHVVGGAANRHKLIEIEGVEPALLRARWPGLDV